VRDGLIKALKITRYLHPGCTPPPPPLEGSGQQLAFHNKTIVMTHNFTISIAAKWLDDYNNAALTPNSAPPARRLTRNHHHRSFPTSRRHADQIPLRRQDRLIFTTAKNKAEGKEFVKFLLQEENVRPISRRTGRWFR